MKCKVCNLKSSYLEEVCYYNIFGEAYSDEYEIENNSNNPDALAHVLCNDCAEEFKFDERFCI